jgi:hypothetical protein
MITGLKNEILNENLRSLVAGERKLTQEILEHIAEIDRRQLFLKMGYASLFAYLTVEIGYSEGAAQRRIDAARLLRKLPEIASEIESGAIHLAQISKIQKICRQIKKESGKPVELEKQRSIIEKLKNQSSRKTDLILAQEFDLKLQIEEKRQIQKDESTRIELTFTKDEMALIKNAQELLSHKTGGTLKATFLELAKKAIQDAKPKSRISFQTINSSTATVAVKSQSAIKALKTVTPRLKKFILTKDLCCQFKDSRTGRLCGSKFFLEVDHIQPKYLNGTNAAGNLRALCKNHNLYRYRAGV